MFTIKYNRFVDKNNICIINNNIYWTSFNDCQTAIQCDLSLKILKVLAPIVLPKYLNCICLFVGKHPGTGGGQYVCFQAKWPKTCFFVNTHTHRRQAQCSTFLFVAPAVQQSELKTMKSNNCILIFHNMFIDSSTWCT